MVTTGNNIRDWLWYIRDRQTIANIVNVALGNEPFPIELNVEQDPMWGDLPKLPQHRMNRDRSGERFECFML